MKVFEQVAAHLKGGLASSPRVNYLVVWVFAGHGVLKDG